MKLIPTEWFVTGLFTLIGILMSGCLGRNALLNRSNGDEIPFVRLERGPLTVTISAVGSTRSAQSAVVSWQVSGKVGEVLVETGQRVEKDEVLARLDPTSLPQSILQAQVDLINAQKALNDLNKSDPLELAQAESNVEQAQDALDELLNPSSTALAQAEKALLDAQDALKDAQKQYDRLLIPRGSAENISIARADYLMAQEKVDRLQEVYDSTSGDPETYLPKAQALSNLESAKIARDRALASLNWYQGKPSDDEFLEKETNLELAQARLADAQQALDDLQSPSETDIALAKSRLADAQQTLSELRDGPSQDDLTIAQTRLTQAQAALSQSRLDAPFSGTVTDIQVLAGDLVAPGQVAFRLDDLSTFFIDLDVSEVDVHLVQVGQPASITFDAILEGEYQGEVVSISEVGELSQGLVNFTVTVRLLDPDDRVKPGITAVANIRVAELNDVLQLPNRVIQEEDGKHFVYKVTPDGFDQVIIQIGATSDTASEVISSELVEGDQIAEDVPLFFGGPPQSAQRGDSQEEGQP